MYKNNVFYELLWNHVRPEYPGDNTRYTFSPLDFLNLYNTLDLSRCTGLLPTIQIKYCEWKSSNYC